MAGELPCEPAGCWAESLLPHSTLAMAQANAIFPILIARYSNPWIKERKRRKVRHPTAHDNTERTTSAKPPANTMRTIGGG